MTREKHPKRFRAKTENGRESGNSNVMRRKKTPIQQTLTHTSKTAIRKWRGAQDVGGLRRGGTVEIVYLL